MDQETDQLELVLSQLDQWRHLPKYKLEQHVDVLFGLTLPAVIKSVFNIREKLHVIPEFPVHHRTARTGKKNNQSFNVDFAVFSSGGKHAFLVELKTDARSIDEDQLRNMRKTRGKLRCLVNAIRTIAKTSQQKRKYLHLLCQLDRVGAMQVGERLKQLDPTGPINGFKAAIACSHVKDSLTHTPNLVLVHPSSHTTERADVSGFCCIDFAQYADELSSDDAVGRMLAPYLRKWRTPAGEVKPRWRSEDSPSLGS